MEIYFLNIKKKISSYVFIVVLYVFFSLCLYFHNVFYSFFFVFTLNLKFSGSQSLLKIEYDTSKPAHIILPCTKPHYVLST